MNDYRPRDIERLAQIGYEAVSGGHGGFATWENAHSYVRDHYRRVARAIANAVLGDVDRALEEAVLGKTE